MYCLHRKRIGVKACMTNQHITAYVLSQMKQLLDTPRLLLCRPHPAYMACSSQKVPAAAPTLPLHTRTRLTKSNCPRLIQGQVRGGKSQKEREAAANLNGLTASCQHMHVWLCISAGNNIKRSRHRLLATTTHLSSTSLNSLRVSLPWTDGFACRTAGQHSMSAHVLYSRLSLNNSHTVAVGGPAHEAICMQAALRAS
jgi:hypothetical protein